MELDILDLGVWHHIYYFGDKSHDQKNDHQPPFSSSFFASSVRLSVRRVSTKQMVELVYL